MSRVIPIQVAGRKAEGPLQFQVPPPLSLYIHVPWCVQKCPYCDFNSHQARGDIPEQDYLAALILDLESALPLIWGRSVVSIFFGGGTPSLLTAEGLDQLLMAIRARVPLAPDAEITLEANPGTVESGRFSGFRQAGINRISLGIQSFNEEHLKALGRIHDGTQASHAAQLAAQHFDRFNLDLMYGLPGQTLAQALADLETALSLKPKHLSCYQLTLEPNTRFAAFPPELPEPDLCADMQEAIESRLGEAGFGHYETSAFALPGFECKHNLNYWLFGDYLGIGAGAHSKLTLHDRVLRQVRWKHPDAYLKQVQAGQPLLEDSVVEAEQLPIEFMMNALRLNQGFDPALFTARTAQPLALIQARLNAAVQEGLLHVTPSRITPTEKGRRFLNPLLQHFI
ncbi:MAG: radical SAM family heme chaperone HemW [Azovibrio sp.]